MGQTVKYAVTLDDKMSKALAVLGINAEEADEEMKKLIAATGGLTEEEAEAALAIRATNKQLEAKAQVLGVTVAEVQKMEQAQKGMSISTQAAVSALAALGVGLARLVKHLADTRNMFNDLAVETGFAASTLQAFDLGARSGGDSLEQIAPSLKQFGKRIRDAMLDTGEAKKSFDRLGVSVTDANGNMRSADEVLSDVSRQMAGVSSATERAAIVNDLFGESGGRILKIVGQGAGALDAYGQKAQALGPSLEAGSKGAQNLQSSLADLETKLLGTADAIVQMLGGEGGAARAIDNFILGFTFVEEIILSLARNWGKFIDLFLSNLTMIPRAIKAAIQGESIVDELVQPFKDFANDIENPLNRAIDKVKQVIAARDQLRDVANGEGGTSVSGLGGFTKPGAGEDALTLGTGATTLTGGQLRAAQEGLASFANEYSADVIAVAEAELGVSISELLEALAGTTDAQQLTGLVDFVKDFEVALKEGEKTVKDRTKADEEAAQASLDAAQAAREAAEAQEQARLQRFAQAGSIVGTAAGGDPTAFLSMAGPQGALVAQVTNLIRSFSDPENNPIAQLEQFLTELMRGLERLPVALTTQFPRIVEQTLPAVLDSLVENLDDIVISVIQAVAMWQTEGTALLISKIDDIILSILTEVIPGALDIDEGGLGPIIEAAAGAARDLIVGLVQLLFDPATWRNASRAVRTNIGTTLGELVANGIEAIGTLGSVLTRIASAIGETIAQAFTVDFWREALQSLIQAIRGFEFNTPGIEAFRTTSGIGGGGGLAQAVAARASGAMGNVIVNGDLYGDNRAFLKRIRDAVQNGRTGISF